METDGNEGMPYTVIVPMLSFIWDRLYRLSSTGVYLLVPGLLAKQSLSYLLKYNELEYVICIAEENLGFLEITGS